jgi:protein-S-isoprenylcysteine O-methyltransferase Ste14
MRSLELKIPPPVVAIATGAAMWYVAHVVPRLTFRFPGLRVAAVALAAAGVVIAALGVIAFRKAKTTVNPLKPQNTSALVATGIFRRTRNPMYLGVALILVGWAVWLGNPLALLVLPLFVGYINRFQIVPEEAMLRSLFPEDFERYRASVPKWF